jgi:hypothetical protein
MKLVGRLPQAPAVLELVAEPEPRFWDWLAARLAPLLERGAEGD